MKILKISLIVIFVSVLSYFFINLTPIWIGAGILCYYKRKGVLK